MSGRHTAALLALAAAAACAAAPPAEAWRDLFAGDSLGAFVATDFGGQGEVTLRDGAIHLGRGEPLTGVTWTGPLPAGQYELEVVATREHGNDFFCGVTFPAGDGHLSLILGGWGGAVCGLSCLDGQDAAHNPTRTLRSFTTGRPYAATILVSGRRVDVRLDGEPFLGADLGGVSCAVRAELRPSRPLGLACFLGDASVQRIRWRPVSR